MKLQKLLILGIICFIISNFFISFCIIHGDSMYPTYKDKQSCLEKKFLNSYKNGDVVVIKKGKNKIIKKIVASPGDTLVIKDNYVYVNDERADDLITEYSGIAGVKINLKPNEYFVLGDNRKNSIDSRFKEIGIINKKEIRGKILNQKNNIITWAIYS